jgi:type I restriction-modification system DNA methylase subunit
MSFNPSLAQLGRDEAQWEAKMFVISNPHFTVKDWANSQPYRDHTAIQHFVDGYLKAGLPA